MLEALWRRTATGCANARWRAGTLLASLAEVLQGACGTQAYGAYLAHHERRHPGEPALTRGSSFARRSSPAGTACGAVAEARPRRPRRPRVRSDLPVTCAIRTIAAPEAAP